jgi:hypothetical protein
MVSVTTGRMPPGMACRTRNAIMLSRFQANPQSAEKVAKPASEML